MDEVVRFSIGDVALAVRQWRARSGGNPAVVLLHGTGGTSRTWDRTAEALCFDRPVSAVDLRGHGDSDRSDRYSIAEMCQDVATLLPRLSDDPVDLVGHSLGGLVALRVAATHPSQVRRLVLEDVGMPHPRVPAPPSRPAGELPFDWRVVEQIRPEIDSPSPDWPEVAHRVNAPTLVVAGRDSFVAAEHVRELLQALPGSRCTILDTGHEVHAERPEEFTEILNQFLAS